MTTVAAPGLALHRERPASSTAGEGALLLAAGETTGWTARLRGQERDEWAWRIALARASLHDGADLVDLGPGPADSLTDDQWPTLRADLCVCDTPFHGKGIDRWLLHSLAHLGPDGRAVVCLPVKTLDPGRREWRVLPTGRVEAIALCPPGLRADTAEPTAIWSVTRRTNTHVLIVDASGLDLPTQDPDDTAGEQRGIDALRDTLRHWRSTGEIPTQPPPGLHLAAVATPDLADRDGDLRPATWTGQPTQAADDETVERALTLARDLHDLIEGPLRGTTTEEHRRGLSRLIKRLGHGSDGLASARGIAPIPAVGQRNRQSDGASDRRSGNEPDRHSDFVRPNAGLVMGPTDDRGADGDPGSGPSAATVSAQIQRPERCRSGSDGSSDDSATATGREPATARCRVGSVTTAR